MTGQLSTVSALPGSQSKKHQKNQTYTHHETPPAPELISEDEEPHRDAAGSAFTFLLTHQPLSITCTQLSPMHLTCPKHGTATIPKSVPTANKISGRGGKEPTLTSQVTRGITIVPAKLGSCLAPGCLTHSPPLLKGCRNWKTEDEPAPTITEN